MGVGPGGGGYTNPKNDPNNKGRGDVGDDNDRDSNDWVDANPPSPTMADRVGAYFEMETAYNFAIGAVIGTLMLGSHGNVSPWGVLAGALATGVVNVIAQHEFRRYSKKQTKRKLKKSLRTPMRKEIRRNVKGGKTGKPKKGKSVANFVKTDVNEGRLIPRKASDKLCKRLKVKNQKTRDAVWAYLNGEAWKICIRWNMQRTYMQKKI